MSGAQTLLISTWISGFVAFVLQLVSFCSPGWVIMDINDTRIDMALWYVTACVTPTNVNDASLEICHTFTYLRLFEEFSGDGSPIQPFSYHQWVEWEAEASLALITCLVGVVLSSLACKRLCSDNRTQDFCIVRIFLLLACLAMLISGVLIMVPMGQIGKAASQLSHISRKKESSLDAFTSGHKMAVGVPHSVIIAGIGGLFSIFSAVLLLCLSSKTKPSHESMNQEFVPMIPAVVIHKHDKGDCKKAEGHCDSSPMSIVKSTAPLPCKTVERACVDERAQNNLKEDSGARNVCNNNQDGTKAMNASSSPDENAQINQKAA